MDAPADLYDEYLAELGDYEPSYEDLADDEACDADYDEPSYEDLADWQEAEQEHFHDWLDRRPPAANPPMKVDQPRVRVRGTLPRRGHVGTTRRPAARRRSSAASSRDGPDDLADPPRPRPSLREAAA